MQRHVESSEVSCARFEAARSRKRESLVALSKKAHTHNNILRENFRLKCTVVQADLSSRLRLLQTAPSFSSPLARIPPPVAVTLSSGSGILILAVSVSLSSYSCNLRRSSTESSEDAIFNTCLPPGMVPGAALQTFTYIH